MLYAWLVAAAILCALQAIRAARLLVAALWLAGTSALLAVILSISGAHEVAVIELSIGAGLVTVLFVFAIGVAGEDAMGAPALLPRWLAAGLIVLAVLLLGWQALPPLGLRAPGAEPSFGTVLWQQRGLDVLVQVVLIFAGVLGVLGLLTEARAPAVRRSVRPFAVIVADPFPSNGKRRAQGIPSRARPVRPFGRAALVGKRAEELSSRADSCAGTVDDGPRVAETGQGKQSEEVCL